MDQPTHDPQGNPYETIQITHFTNRKRDLHKVGGPAQIIESTTVRQLNYKQNSRPHRAHAPSTLLIDKATGTVLYEEWRSKGSLGRDSGPADTERDAKTGAYKRQLWVQPGGHIWNYENPWCLLYRDRTTGDVKANWNGEGSPTTKPPSAHEAMARENRLRDPAGPWHRDPDYSKIPDKPKVPDYEREIHFKTRGVYWPDQNRVVWGHTGKTIHHRDGNKPALVIRDRGSVDEVFYLDGKRARTDGGPTNVITCPVLQPGTPATILKQEWLVPLKSAGGREYDGHDRKDAPAEIFLHANGSVVERWHSNDEPYAPTAHEQMKWAQTKMEQGGPLWVPPEQRYPDGPDGPSQVLIHPDTGVRWHEARYNAAGELDRDNGPSLTIRDQQTGKPLFVAHHKDGQLHRETGPALQIFEAKTGALLMEKWARNGQPYEPTADERLQWEASQRPQTKRPGGVKAAAAAAAAAKATEAKATKIKAADRGDER